MIGMGIHEATIAALEESFKKEMPCEVEGHGTEEDSNIHDTGGARWKVTSYCKACKGEAHVLMCNRAHTLALLTVSRGVGSLRCGMGHETPIVKAYVRSTPWG